MRSPATLGQPRPAAAPPGPSPWLGFSALSVGTLMATLDSSIVNVALPTLRRELGASFAGVEWIVASYLLVISAALLSSGRLGDILGHRRVYVGGLLLFTLGSAACGLARGLVTLVAARALQAVGASATMAMGPALITILFPAQRRGRALGAIASVVALGLTLGPPLGGFIVQRLSWRWIFLPNVPIGVAGAIWAARVLPGARHDRGARLDLAGALLLAVAVGGSVAGLQATSESAPRAAALGAAAAGAAAWLVAHLRRSAQPVLDARLFTIRTFSAGIAGGLLSYAALFTSTFLTPFFLAQVKALAPGQLGAMMTVVPLALSVVSPLAGWLTDRVDPRVLCPLGAVLVAAGLGSLALVRADDGLAGIAARLAFCGVGMGLFQPPNNNAVMGSLPRERLGSGGGMLATARNLGMVLGIAVAGALFRAGGGEDGEGFLAGYRLALGAGAALALAAGVASLARAPRAVPVDEGSAG